MNVELNQVWTYECWTCSMLTLWLSKLINLILWVSSSINFEFKNVELAQCWPYECRTWSILGLWVSNLINLGPMNVELNQCWAYGCRTWSSLGLWVSNLINIEPMNVELEQYFAKNNRAGDTSRKIYNARCVAPRAAELPAELLFATPPGRMANQGSDADVYIACCASPPQLQVCRLKACFNALRCIACRYIALHGMTLHECAA